MPKTDTPKINTKLSTIAGFFNALDSCTIILPEELETILQSNKIRLDKATIDKHSLCEALNDCCHFYLLCFNQQQQSEHVTDKQKIDRINNAQKALQKLSDSLDLLSPFGEDGLQQNCWPENWLTNALAEQARNSQYWSLYDAIIPLTLPPATSLVTGKRPLTLEAAKAIVQQTKDDQLKKMSDAAMQCKNAYTILALMGLSLHTLGSMLTAIKPTKETAGKRFANKAFDGWLRCLLRLWQEEMGQSLVTVYEGNPFFSLAGELHKIMQKKAKAQLGLRLTRFNTPENMLNAFRRLDK